jgi:hypothetical protein
LAAPTPSTPAGDLARRLADPATRPQSIADAFDALAPAQRVAAARALGRAAQRRLYELVDGFRPLRLSDLVPPDRPDFVQVRHYGRNTLPVFTHFEKRFCRPKGADAAKPDSLYGYNFQTMAPLTGPGYFVARDDEHRPEVLVDYNLIPDDHPAGWPEIKRNDQGLSRFVYGFMIDTLRGVSEHVSIGSAARKGKDMGSWFILCREA